MKQPNLTFKELSEHPDVKALVSSLELEEISKTLSSKGKSDDPVYIKILSGIGAWFAAIFLIAFLGMVGLIDGDMSAIVCGLAFLACTVFLSKKCKSNFPSQLALALAFAGNIIVVFGSKDLLPGNANEILSVMLVHAVVCTAMYFLYPSNVYRFFAPAILVIIATIWMAEHQTYELMHILIIIETLLAGILLLHTRQSPFIRPLMHSTAAMLPATMLFMSLTQGDMFGWHLWSTAPSFAHAPSSVFLSIGIVYMYIRLAGGPEYYRSRILILAVISTLLLGAFTNPGILIAIGLLVAGYAFSDRILTALSYLFLTCFLIVFYYAMNVNLANKSWIMAGSGLILLAMSFFARKTRPVEDPQ